MREDWQGGVYSLKLHSLPCRLILWSRDRFLSLQATHVLGTLKVEVDMLSDFYSERSLHPAVVEQIWACFGRASLDLFTENAQYMFFFSQAGDSFFHCSVGAIMSFLQDLIDNRKDFSLMSI